MEKYFFYGLACLVLLNFGRRQGEKKSRVVLLGALILCVFFVSRLSVQAGTGDSIDFQKAPTVVFVNSYHKGYAWSDGIQQKALEVLQDAGVQTEIFYLDSKRCKAAKQIRNVSRRVAEKIAKMQPDVIITADDNAQKHLVVPYLKHLGVPIVYCGVNFDGSEYGYPNEFATGMLEHSMITQLKDNLLRLSKGERLCALADDAFSEHKYLKRSNERYFNDKLQLYFAKDFKTFKEMFLQAQSDCDALMIINQGSIMDWDEEEAVRFMLDHVKIPTGTTAKHLARLNMLVMAKAPEEHGEWAAKTALHILAGESPGDIPETSNQQARIIINLEMAKAAGIVIPVDLLRAANEVIGQEALYKSESKNQEAANGP